MNGSHLLSVPAEKHKRASNRPLRLDYETFVNAAFFCKAKRISSHNKTPVNVKMY